MTTASENLRVALLQSNANALPLGETDWYYQNMCPKDFTGMLRFREALHELVYKYPELEQDVWDICSRDILFSINAFGWTHDKRKHPKQPIRPFITYPYQDRAIRELQASIGESDVAVPKTRDMGASWICLLVLEWFWRFRDNQSFLIASRKQELVDGDERALLPKIDWYHSRLPNYLLPKLKAGDRKSMRLFNSTNGSAIDGEATVQNLGTGDRRTAVFLDEIGKVENADKIFTSTRDVTQCRIFNSTPFGRYGMGAPFYQRVKNPSTKKIFMHWTEHPMKNQGLFKIVDDKKIELDPETYDWRDDYSFEQLTFLGNKPRSPWYDAECRREGFDPDTGMGASLTIAQELDIDFAGSAERLIDDRIIANVRKRDVQLPSHRGRVDVDFDTLELVWRPLPPEAKNASFLFWGPFDGHEPPNGLYVAGIDISAGTGNATSSNSAIVILNRETHEQVARYAANILEPRRFARLAIAVCRWFNNAYMVPEANGAVGASFIDECKKCDFYNIYQRVRDVIGLDNRKSKTYGHHNRDGGQQILSKLAADADRGDVLLRDDGILEELGQYEFKGGKVFHGGAAGSQIATDSEATHGDVAIAAALAWMGLGDRPAGKRTFKKPEMPLNCPARRHKKYRDEMSQKGGDDDWDW